MKSWLILISAAVVFFSCGDAASKKEPLKIIDKVNFEIMDHEGRYIELVFDNLSVISTYLPSGSSGDIRQQIKFECLDFLKSFLEKKI